MKATHLASTILAALGIAQPLGCSDDGTNDDSSDLNCGHVIEEREVAPGCVVNIATDTETVRECQVVELVNGSCPGFEEVSGNFSGNPICGPYAAEGGAGAGGAGAGGAGGGNVGGAALGGAAAGGASAGGASAGGAFAGGASAGGAAAGGAFAGGDGGGVPIPMGECCYEVHHDFMCGRPFFVDGVARVATRVTTRGRGADALVDVTPAARQQIAEEWLRDAFMEHASVASFARFALDLLSLGAPLDLVEGAQQAMADELRHTRSCFEMAARYGAGNVEPGSLELGASGRASLEAIVHSAVREGCVGETIAALLASRAAEAAADPLARATQSRIADDETRHAALAWRFVGWAIQRGGETAQKAVVDALELAQADLARGLVVAEASAAEAVAREMRSHGRLPARERSAIAAEALDEVVFPCMRAMFERASQLS